jgi:hypothetical protein
VTDAQISRHWRDWGAVAKANGWRMRKGRLVCLEAEQIVAGFLEDIHAGDGARGATRPTTFKSEQHAKVWTFAEQLAARGHRAVTADDLRHACYLAAFGRRGVDGVERSDDQWRIQSIAGVVGGPVDPDNLQAQVDWMHPEEAQRRGLVASILRNAPGEAYVIAIAKRKFGTAAWRIWATGNCGNW